MEKRWTVKPKADEKIVDSLAKALGIKEVLANLLVQRGITTFDEAKTFFRPNIDDLYDPFLMKDMEKAIARMEKAIQSKEKILVFGDYDVDGTTAVALVYSFLKKLVGDNTEYYIPDRYKEGYGVSFQGIDYAKQNNFSLIIALDCGIKSVDKVEYANERNVDFIICDHHLPGDEIPDAAAVLDAKQKDCNYPFKELCGCGVGFKLVQAYAQKNGIPFSDLYEYLDLTAISIASDLVPIVDENRILCTYGLQQINKNPRKGIAAVLELTNIKKSITVNELLFTIGPRINAAGRLESGNKAVELLISENVKVAQLSSKNIDNTNTERRGLDKSITEEALEIIHKDPTFKSRKSTVVFHPEWHKGVIGIVASRLIENHYRPTIVLTESNGMATGSARSVKDFNVHAALESCADLLEQFGGHMYAAGMSLKMENLEAFKNRFEEAVSNTIEDRMLVPEIEIDTHLKLEDITPKFFRILKQFEPFGPGNLSPVFCSTDLQDTGYSKIVGETHLKLSVQSPTAPDVKFSGIGFSLGDKLTRIEKPQPFDACYAIEENEFRGNVSLQLNVKDIK